MNLSDLPERLSLQPRSAAFVWEWLLGYFLLGLDLLVTLTRSLGSRGPHKHEVGASDELLFLLPDGEFGDAGLTDRNSDLLGAFPRREVHRVGRSLPRGLVHLDLRIEVPLR